MSIILSARGLCHIDVLQSIFTGAFYTSWRVKTKQEEET